MAGTPTLIRYADGYLVCDSVLDSSIVATAEFTEHAIEVGSPITDHAIHKPLEWSLTLTATDTPITAQHLSPGGDVLAPTGVAKQAITRQLRTTDPPGHQSTELKIRPSEGQQLNVSAAIGAAIDRVRNAAAGPTELTGRAGAGAVLRSLNVEVLTTDAPVDRIHAFYQQLLDLMFDVAELAVIYKGRTYEPVVLTSVTKVDQPGQFGRSTFPVTFRELLTVETKQVTLPAVPKQKSKKDLGAKPTVPASEQQSAFVLRSSAVSAGIATGVLSE